MARGRAHRMPEGCSSDNALNLMDTALPGDRITSTSSSSSRAAQKDRVGSCSV